jgi:hypothetical protein
VFCAQSRSICSYLKRVEMGREGRRASSLLSAQESIDIPSASLQEIKDENHDGGGCTA